MGIEHIAGEFVRVRRSQIDDADLGLFDFDYDLTLMVFFLDAAENIYVRYGGRDASGPDSRQSLAGLRQAAEAALELHRKGITPKTSRGPETRVSDFQPGRGRGCVHCHEAKELMYSQLREQGKWTRDLIWRYPLPDNLGFVLDIDRGNVIRTVKPETPAAQLGLLPGDTIHRIGGHLVHTFADAQFALDRAPKTGLLAVAWQRKANEIAGKMLLPAGWRKTDIQWRPSMRSVIPSARVYGRDLTATEKREHGLKPEALAFWQGYPVSSPAKAAGVREGDIILGFDGHQLEMEAYDFLGFVRRTYLRGDRVKVRLIRNNQRIQLMMTLR